MKDVCLLPAEKRKAELILLVSLHKLEPQSLCTGPGAILAAAATAVLLRFTFPYDWTWVQCLLVGSILSATDPVAVAAVLSEVGVHTFLSGATPEYPSCRDPTLQMITHGHACFFWVSIACQPHLIQYRPLRTNIVT